MITIYTRRLLADWQIGRAIGPVVLIDPAHRGDVGVLAHEREHVVQWAVAAVLTAAVVIALAHLAGIGLDAVTAGLVADPFGPMFMGVTLATAVILAAHHGWMQFAPVYRLYCEIEAYRAQACYSADSTADLERFAKALATDYGFDITEAEALRRLREV